MMKPGTARGGFGERAASPESGRGRVLGGSSVQDRKILHMPETVFPVKPEIAARARVTAEQYRAMAERALADPAGFWASECRRITWMKNPTRMLSGGFTGDVR